MSTTENLTKADRGLLVYGTLTEFMKMALKASTSASDALLIKKMHTEATEHLTKATGFRLATPDIISSITTEEEAAILSQSVKRVQQFLTAKFKSTDWKAEVMASNASLKNVVDHQVYDHLATVYQGKNVFYFCLSNKGRYSFCESKYWTAPK